MTGQSLCILVLALFLVTGITGSLDQNISPTIPGTHENIPSIPQPGPGILSATNPVSDQIPDQIINGSFNISPEGNESLNISPEYLETDNGVYLIGSMGQGKGSGVAREQGNNGQENNDKPSHAEGELIIRFVTEPGKKAPPAISATIHRAVGASVRKDYSGKGLAGTQLVILPPGLSVEEGIARYANNPAVLSVQPNYRIDLMAIPDAS